MGFLARLFEGEAPPPSPLRHNAPADTVESLSERAREVVALVNQSGDVMPTIGSALARRIIDAVEAILARGDLSAMGPQALSTLRGVLTAYLPETIESFTAAARSGHPDEVGLMHQLTALHHSAVAILVAAREGDAQAMEVQGTFLRTKFTQSDLDL